MSSSDGPKWLVAVVDSVFSKEGKNNKDASKLIKLKDPAIGESREYIFANDKDIVEVQSLEADFSSFIIGRHIVKDGNLYVFNRVDPLFWALSQNSPSKECKQWVGYEQIVESLPQEVRKSLEENQIGHLCLALSPDQTGGDVPYYKFNAEKALKWLQKKYDRVYQCLLHQNQTKQMQEKEIISKKGREGGSVSASFHMPDADPMAATPKSDDVVSDTKMLKVEAAQVVSSYLSTDWSTKFLESISMNQEIVNTVSSAKKDNPPTSAKRTLVEDSSKEIQNKSIKKVEQARTMGNKRLAKVNTKGMKSLSSFFGAPKKKTKTQ